MVLILYEKYKNCIRIEKKLFDSIEVFYIDSIFYVEEDFYYLVVFI